MALDLQELSIWLWRQENTWTTWKQDKRIKRLSAVWEVQRTAVIEGHWRIKCKGQRREENVHAPENMLWLVNVSLYPPSPLWCCMRITNSTGQPVSDCKSVLRKFRPSPEQSFVSNHFFKPYQGLIIPHFSLTKPLRFLNSWSWYVKMFSTKVNLSKLW